MARPTALRLSVLPAAAVAGLLLAAAPASAQVACDSYSGGCLPLDGGTNQPAQGGDEGTGVVDRSTGGTTDVRPASLPFTGGELVLGSLLGVGAAGAGVLLVAAGRRRTPSPV